MGRKKLDDPVVRNVLLALIRAGHGRHAAAEQAGVSISAYTSYYKANETFRDEVEAAMDASVEPVLAMLREEAMSGDVTAAKEYLKHVAPPARAEQKKVEHTHTVGLDAATLDSIEAIRARAQERLALPQTTEPRRDVIDVTAYEHEGDSDDD